MAIAPFLVPDNNVAATPKPQSWLYRLDLQILSQGHNDYGVVSGSAVTQRGAGANMSVDVAAGTTRHGAIENIRGGTTNLVISAASPLLYRLDTIVIDVSGTPQVRAGTAAALQLLEPGDPNDTDVILAYVLVAPGATSILTANVQDRRNNKTRTARLDGLTGGQTFIGGTGTADPLILRSTSGAGATDYIAFQVGNNGGTEGLRISSNGSVSIGSGISLANSLFGVFATRGANYVMADFEYVQTGTGFDSGALRAVASSLVAGSNSIRAGEFQVLRGTSASSNGTWGIEIGVHSQVAGNGTSLNLGIYLTSSHTGWLASGVRNDSAIIIGGEDGWTHGVRYLDTDGTTVLFDIDQFGNVLSIGNLISAPQTHMFAKSSSYALLAGDVQGFGLTVVQASNTITITMPPVASTNMGQICIFNAGVGTITIARNSSEVFVLADGTTPTSLTISATFKKYTMVSNGANWIVLYHD